MLKLYNAGASVCSVKVRLGLAEKQLEWDDVMLSLPKGEQHAPDYLKLNPNGVVPTLVHDGLVILESSVILEYIDSLTDLDRLMPSDKTAEVATRVWLLRCLDIHAAINTMTFTTASRDTMLAKQTPDQIAASIAKMPDPRAAAKRRDLMDNGLASNHVIGDFFTLRRLFDDMQTALDQTEWLTGNSIGLADVALTAYVDRLDRLGMSGLWEERTPVVGTWLAALKSRPSYSRAIDPYVSKEEAAATRAGGAKHWPEVQSRWDAFLA